MAKSAAEVMVEVLAASGIKRVYGLPGDSLNGITDAIRQHPEMEWVHVRHEEVAAFAAGAEAHLTGELTVCAGSCGPGNLHLINGIYDCNRSRVPVLAIAAQIPSAELGTGYFQETHPEMLYKESSVFCELVSDPENVPRILRIAMRAAIARRGVAVVVVPGDVFLGDCPSSGQVVPIAEPQAVMQPCTADLRAAAAILNDAGKVTILAGAGCAGAHTELMELAEALKAPIVHALRGKEYVEYDNPYDVGMTGLLGFSSGYYAMMNCDALLMLGTDFPYTQFFPEKAKIIQVDVRGEQIARRTRVDLGLTGTVRDTAAALTPLIKKKKNQDHLKTSVDHYKKARTGLDELAVGEPGKTPIHPQYVARLIDELATEDAVITCDVGLPTVWAARYLRMNGKRRLLGSFVHGSMASAVPQAIGAQATDRRRQVVALAGDGGLAMLLGDLLTLRQMRLPVKIVVFNNGSLGFVELEMKAAGFLDFGTSLENPSFAEIAKACGFLGIRVEKPEEVAGALEQAFAYDGPALVDVVVNRQELSLPPTIEFKQATGFGLYIMKAVMNGRADEVIDLAKTNLFR
jgi:thiamine pyrophosphate-dependent acetolactate synthase large subunit-like protein